MDPAEWMAIFNHYQRKQVTWPGMLRQEVNGVVRQFAPAGGPAFIEYSELDETTADAAIQQEIDFFTALGRGFEWKLYDSDRPADLQARLQARGFVLEDPEALVVLELSPEHPLLMQPIPPEIHPVTDDAGVAGIQAMSEAVWNEERPWLAEQLKTDLHSHPDRISIYAAWVDGRVVSAAWIYYHPGTPFASLWGGSTLAEYRGRGLYTGLLAARAQAARQRGYSLLYVDASPMSRPILEKHGFVCLGFSRPCNFEPPA